MTIILSIEYDGTNYSGWQIQENADTVQGKINGAISQIFGLPLETIGAGRTDAGVHAKSQIAHFICGSPKITNRNKLILAINSFLPDDIRINNAWFTETDFHSRYDAIAREYKYRFCLKKTVFTRFFVAYLPYKIDEQLLFEAANIFIGKHNFRTFSKLNRDTKNYFCDVTVCNWLRLDETNFELTIKADRFVYGMVRSLVGVMFDIARGKRSLSEVKESLFTGEKKYISPLANACGLTLHKIYYPEHFTFLEQ